MQFYVPAAGMQLGVAMDGEWHTNATRFSRLGSAIVVLP